MNDTKGTILLLVGLFILIGLSFQPLKENIEKNKQSQTNQNQTVGKASIGSDHNYSINTIDIAESIKDAEYRIKRLEEEINKKIEESKKSPYYGKISVSGVYGIWDNDPNKEYITLYASLDRNEKVNITGWYFKSEITGNFAVIGKASLLPFPFTSNDSDIILKNGDRVYITKGFSPIGISFRTNMCTGYFEENREFTPSLELACPLAKDENLPKFSSIYDRNDECLDIIERIPRCTTRNGQYFRDLPDTVPPSCQTYIDTNINYNSCVAKHFGSTKFPGNEYRVYLKKFGPLWRNRREKINLHDSKGLIVGTITIY